jgi:membrane protein
LEHEVSRGSGPVRRNWKLVKEAIRAWNDDYAQSMGAALAYYTIFSLAPLLIVVIAMAGLLFGQDVARGRMMNEFRNLVGVGGADAIQSLLVSASRPTTSVLATAIGLITLFLGATSVFAELQNALDRIWRAPALKQSQGLVALIQSRLLSFGMVIAMGFLLLVSLVISAALSAVDRWGGELFPTWGLVIRAVNQIASFALTTVLFAMAYRILPRVRIAWSDVWIGSLVTAALFTIGKYLIGLYLGRAGITSGFGAAGSLVVILLWVYYSAQVFLLGAEFTWVYAHRQGSRAGETPPPAPPIPVAPTK